MVRSFPDSSTWVWSTGSSRYTLKEGVASSVPLVPGAFVVLEFAKLYRTGSSLSVMVTVMVFFSPSVAYEFSGSLSAISIVSSASSISSSLTDSLIVPY